MKKKLLFIVSTVALLLGACTTTTDYVPKAGGTSSYVEPEKVPDVTIEFYLSYSHTHCDDKTQEAALFTLPWFSLTPIGQVPEAINSLEKILAIADAKGYVIDPAFPVWKGWSKFGCCLRDADLWNFEKDYEQKAVVALYGIWVAE